jgi:hypothetical protein
MAAKSVARTLARRRALHSRDRQRYQARMPTRPFALGRGRESASSSATAAFELPAHHLVTHGVIVGMTGSGKTGLAMVMVEEALRSRVPVLLVDVKGDLGNLLLTFPELLPAEFAPWVDEVAAQRDGKTSLDVATELATRWREGLASWGLSASDTASLRASIAPRVLTPGSTAGEPVHVFSALEQRSSLWEDDEEAARESLAGTLSLVLRLVDRDPDPAKSREHVMLAHLAERRLRAGGSASLTNLLADLEAPPIARIGALEVDDFLPPKERRELAQQLNTLLASPTFQAWQRGAPLDVASWLTVTDGRTPAIIVSVAHLDDDERKLVLGLLFEQLLAWVRGLSGTSDLRALVLFDEVFGFLPPHPYNPPTKRPLLALLKQARAFGVGVVLATQNPMDLDYKALSNAGAWFVGRLQTDADRERVVEGLAISDGGAGLEAGALGATLKALPPRTFFVRNVHQKPATSLLETRWSLAWLRGPLTRKELARVARLANPLAKSSVVTEEKPHVAKPPEPAPKAKEAAPKAPLETTTPTSPDGFATYFAFASAGARYLPWVAVRAVAHCRDTKLGVTRNLELRIAAPLNADARPDLTQARALDPRLLTNAPAPNASFAPLPEALRKKASREAIERALREHVYRSAVAELQVHEGLGLSRDESETEEAFVTRCRAAAGLLAQREHQAIASRYEPKLEKLRERYATARAKVTQAEVEAGEAPGAMGAVLLNVIAGKRAGNRAMSARDRAVSRVAKAREDLAATEAALREAGASRDAELAALARLPEEAAHGISRVELRPKKADIDLLEVAIAWASSA